MMGTTLVSPLSAVAAYGVITAFLRRDWRVLPLLAWLIVSFLLLLFYHPLFLHHLIILEPPLIALAVLGMAQPEYYKKMLAKLKLADLAYCFTLLAIVLVLGVSYTNFQKDNVYYKALNIIEARPYSQGDLRIASDLAKATSPGDLVVTDGQFLAALANRDVPPWLVDTSDVRILTGSLTLAQLEQETLNPRVRAVLFLTNRFDRIKVRSFHTWVSQHFHLAHDYGNGQELWVR
jgi:hypothetical protein